MSHNVGDIVLFNGEEYILTQDPDGLREYYGGDKVEENEWGVLPYDIDIAKKGLVEDIISKSEFESTGESIELKD